MCQSEMSKRLFGLTCGKHMPSPDWPLKQGSGPWEDLLFGWNGRPLGNVVALLSKLILLLSCRSSGSPHPAPTAVYMAVPSHNLTTFYCRAICRSRFQRLECFWLCLSDSDFSLLLWLLGRPSLRLQFSFHRCQPGACPLMWC